MHMWEQYKKTLTSMQVTIALVSLATLIWSHHLYLAGTFFITMQLGAFFGAAWGTRLKRMFAARDGVGAPQPSRIE
jgi:hypothetical protein